MYLSILHCNLGPASAPINVAAVSISSTQVKVTWGDVPPTDQNGIIITYEVEYIPLEDFDGAIGKSTTNVSALSLILLRLQEYVNYTISVRAYTSAGAGPYSDPVSVLTNEDGKCVKQGQRVLTYNFSHKTEPTNPPDNVRATATSSTTIVVMWHNVPPIDQNGVITMYEVMYTPSQDFGGAIGTRTTNVTELSVLLMNLEENINYSISVLSYTSVGPGPNSDPLTILTNEDGRCC